MKDAPSIRWLACLACVATLECAAATQRPAAEPSGSAQACAPPNIAGFPLFPEAAEDAGLAGTMRLGAKRFRVRVFRVARGKREVLAYYVRCLGREPSRESEEGSDHFEGGGATLTISGTRTETTLRIRYAD